MKEGGGMIRTGTYRDQNGNLVHVRRTATGFVIRHHDGRVESIPANRGRA